MEKRTKTTPWWCFPNTQSLSHYNSCGDQEKGHTLKTPLPSRAVLKSAGLSRMQVRVPQISGEEKTAWGWLGEGKGPPPLQGLPLACLFGSDLMVHLPGWRRWHDWWLPEDLPQQSSQNTELAPKQSFAWPTLTCLGKHPQIREKQSNVLNPVGEPGRPHLKSVHCSQEPEYMLI